MSTICHFIEILCTVHQYTSVAVLGSDTQHIFFSQPNHTICHSVSSHASLRCAQMSQTQQTCSAFFPSLSRCNVSLVKQNKSNRKEPELSPFQTGHGVRQCVHQSPLIVYVLGDARAGLSCGELDAAWGVAVPSLRTARKFNQIQLGRSAL